MWRQAWPKGQAPLLGTVMRCVGAWFPVPSGEWVFLCNSSHGRGGVEVHGIQVLCGIEGWMSLVGRNGNPVAS